jgi:hypothetical protein
VIRNAKAEGKYQEGIVDVAGENFKTISESVLWKNKQTDAEIKLVSIQGDRGVTWDDALQRLETFKEEDPDDVYSGFYRKGQQIMLWIARKGQKMAKASPLNVLVPISPETGFGKEKTKKAVVGVIDSTKRHNMGMRRLDNIDEAKKLWERAYVRSATKCGHDGERSCKGRDCLFKKRVITCHVLVGSLMDCWDTLKEVLVDGKGGAVKGKALKVTSRKGNRCCQRKLHASARTRRRACSRARTRMNHSF